MQRKPILIYLKNEKTLRVDLLEKRGDTLIVVTEENNILILPPNQVKYVDELKGSQMYMEGNAGILRDYNPPYLLNAALGYEFKEVHGIGLTWTTFEKLIRIKGLGIQYRYKPTRLTILKAEIGYIVRNPILIDDGPISSSYLRNKSIPIYMVFSGSYRFASILTISLSIGTAAKQTFQFSKSENGNTVLLNEGVRNVSIVMPTIGLSIPSYPKKK